MLSFIQNSNVASGAAKLAKAIYQTYLLALTKSTVFQILRILKSITAANQPFDRVEIF